MTLLRPDGLKPDEIFLDGDESHFVNGKGQLVVPQAVAAWEQDQLSADVSMTSANTAYNGPTVTLDPGRWFLSATVTLLAPASAVKFTAKLWDGTTVESSTEQPAASGAVVSVSLHGVVGPTLSTDYKVTCLCDTAAAKIKAAAVDNAAGNTASTLVAVRIG